MKTWVKNDFSFLTVLKTDAFGKSFPRQTQYFRPNSFTIFSVSMITIHINPIQQISYLTFNSGDETTKQSCIDLVDRVNLVVRYFLSISAADNTYHIVTLVSVHGPVCSILTVRHLVSCYPLVGILSTFCDYFLDFHRSSKVHFKPLMVIVVACAPGPPVPTPFDCPQPRQSGIVVFVPL